LDAHSVHTVHNEGYKFFHLLMWG